jgi:hypothetical protein
MSINAGLECISLLVLITYYLYAASTLCTVRYIYNKGKMNKDLQMKIFCEEKSGGNVPHLDISIV